ncbi:hypothetical protein JL722_4966 [Aureococcus anophagefferens]|nr:hypothetical protein JL722_4966 [Aureococcus anophagefferens]
MQRAAAATCMALAPAAYYRDDLERTGRAAFRVGDVTFQGLRTIAEYKGATTPEEVQACHARGAARLRDLAATYGGLLCKFGQHPCSDDGAVRALLDRELGPGAFRDLRPPIASASIAEVRPATLDDGTAVAVKVMHPALEASIACDLYALEVCFALSRLADPRIADDWAWLLPEFRDGVELELDFVNEGATAERAGALLARRHGSRVRVPAVHWSHTTKRVLTMDYVEGHRVAATAAPRDTAWTSGASATRSRGEAKSLGAKITASDATALRGHVRDLLTENDAAPSSRPRPCRACRGPALHDALRVAAPGHARGARRGPAPALRALRRGRRAGNALDAAWDAPRADGAASADAADAIARCDRPGHALNAPTPSERAGARETKWAGLARRARTALRWLRLRANLAAADMAVARRAPRPDAAPDANVPQKYVASCGGDVAEARRRWDDTRRWRGGRADGILAERPLYGAIRRCYPHYYAGSGRDGQPVYVENVGRVDVDGLAEAGVDADAMLRHYVFLNEWTWRELQPAADGPASYNVTVLDLDGLKLAQCRGVRFDYVKRCAVLARARYPERCGLMVIANAPSWFALVYRFIRPFVAAGTQRKIRVTRSNAATREALREVADDASIPACYGGLLVGDSDAEKALARFVAT